MKGTSLKIVKAGKKRGRDPAPFRRQIKVLLLRTGSVEKYLQPGIFAETVD